MAPFIVLAFAASQMIAFFNWSNIGSILAIKGAELLQALNFTGLPMMIGFVLICAFVNLLIASASAKWALLAPIFVPMFLYLGYSPAVTQMAYRVGDSITNQPLCYRISRFYYLLQSAMIKISELVRLSLLYYRSRCFSQSVGLSSSPFGSY